jgi:hypothetical protein
MTLFSVPPQYPNIVMRSTLEVLILKEKQWLRVIENRALRKVFGPKREELRGGGENCIMRTFMIRTNNKI